MAEKKVSAGLAVRVLWRPPPPPGGHQKAAPRPQPGVAVLAGGLAAAAHCPGYMERMPLAVALSGSPSPVAAASWRPE